MLLITGAEDGRIRVLCSIFTATVFILSRSVYRCGRLPSNVLFIHTKVIKKRFIHLTFRSMGAWSYLDQGMGQQRYGICLRIVCSRYICVYRRGCWRLTFSQVLTVTEPDSSNNDPGIASVAFSPNGQFIATGCLDSTVRIWEVSTGHMVETLRGHKDSVYSVAFTPDGKELVSGSLDKTLKLWDVSWLSVAGQTKCKMSLTGHKVRIF